MNVRATPPAQDELIMPSRQWRDGVSTRDSFENLQSRLGMGQMTGFAGPGGAAGYGGPSNLISQSSYTLNPVSRNRVLLEWAYRGSWIIRNAVDCVADDLTRAGIDMQSVEHPDEIEVLQEGYKRLGIWKSLSDVARWARLYGGALGVLMIDGQDLETPLRPNTVGKGQFRGILVLDRWLVQPSLNDLVDEMGPDFGLPRYYDVVADFYPIPNARIHHSRCVRLDGSEIPFWQRIAENMWNVSVLEPLWDRLVAFDSTTQGIAQLAFKAHLRVIRMKELRNNIAAGGKKLENVAKMMEHIRQTQCNEGITLIDADDEFASNTYTFAGLSDVLSKFEAQLAGATKIPIVRLFGQSPGGLNSTGESDTRNYYDGIHQEQENTLRLPVTRINELLHYSELGHAPEPGFTFEFASLWQLTELEKGQLTAAVTGAVNQTFEQGYVSAAVALKELRQLSRVTNIWSNISDEDIGAAEDKPPLEIQKEMMLGPGAETDYNIRKLENMPHIDIPATPEEQADLIKLQKQFGVGSKPIRPDPISEPGAPGGVNPSPEQLLQLGHLHQEHVVNRLEVPVPQGNGAIQPTPDQQAELNALYSRFAMRDSLGETITATRRDHADIINRQAVESQSPFRDAYDPNEPRKAKGEVGGGEWTAGGASGKAKEPDAYKPGDRIISMQSGEDYAIESIDKEGNIHIGATRDITDGFVIWPEDRKNYKRIPLGVAIPEMKSDLPAEVLHSMGGDLPRFNELIEFAKSKVKELGYDPDKVKVSPWPDKVVVGDMTGESAGGYTPNTGEITTVYRPEWTLAQVGSTLAHEVMHAKYYEVARECGKDTDLGDKFRTILQQYREEEGCMALARSDGVTHYSLGHWAGWTQEEATKGFSPPSAPLLFQDWGNAAPITETLSEIAALDYLRVRGIPDDEKPGGYQEGNHQSWDKIAPIWISLYNDINKCYYDLRKQKK